MKNYVVLLRGINVGGKNKIPMADLRQCLEELGFKNVSTYIQSGNVLLQSDLTNKQIGETIEAVLTKKFKLDSSIIRVLALTHAELKAIIDNKPKGFGDKPDTYHSDAIFLMGIPMDEALSVFKPRDGVDKIWPGKDVIYSQRLSAERTKSRLASIIGTKPYQSMTIRSWNTATKLLGLLDSYSS
jgi:uncharacterized protein (DUF1697 family)